MTVSKTTLFNKELQTAATFYKALSHPARLAILKYLADAKVCMTGDICDELPLSRSTVNQHLKELKEVGLITGEIEGVKVNYCLNSKKLGELKVIISDFITELNTCNNNKCE